MPETAFFTARGEVLLMSKEAKATACEYTKRVTEAMFYEKKHGKTSDPRGRVPPN